jgi:microcystin-dependent protein
MSTEPFIGEIKIFGFNFAPRGYALCQGQIMSIAQNTALFSLLGTTYGGNGQQTFGLPDLRGRTPVGQGQGPGLRDVQMGEIAGTESVTLNVTQMPAHTHIATATSALFAEGGTGTAANPAGKLLAGLPNLYIAPDGSVPNKQLSTESVTTAVTNSIAGNNQPVGILNPYLGLNYSIAVEGIFPSRN